MSDMRIAAAADPGIVPHGTANGYRNYGCRLDCCRVPATAYQREYRRLRRRLAGKRKAPARASSSAGASP